MKEWELKKIISNLAVTGNRALTQVDEKQRQIENLKQQLAEMHHKRVVNRTRIPTCGKAWIDQEHIASFFESQSTEQRKSMQKKYLHATNLIAVREKKLAQCTRKRKEAERLEEEGKLPKSRKTGTTLLQQEASLRKQMSEARGKVEKLEKHLEDLVQDVVQVGESFFRRDEAEMVCGCDDIGSVLDEEELDATSEEGAGAGVAPAPRRESVDFLLGM